jgi:hypothetical protein
VKRFLTLEKWRQLGPEAGNQAGLWALLLDCWQRDGAGFDHVGRLIVNSGQPYAQVFRTLDRQVSGRFEPLPEGVYTPGPVEFASGIWGDYSQQFHEVQSPIWWTIYGPRSIGGHLDGNRRDSPGSAACVVYRTMDDLKTYVNWCEGDPYKMTSLWVNWHLGTVKYPAGLVIPPFPKAA